MTAFKVTMSLSYILSGIFMYLFARTFFNDTQKAVLSTLFYQFATFRFVELLVRGSMGEVYTYTFLPLLLLGITHLAQKISYKSIVLTAFATALLILSHNSVSLLFFGVSVLFTLFFVTKKTNKMVVFASLSTGVLLSAFYWVPAIAEHKFTYGDLLMKELYVSHFAPLQNFFIPNFTNEKILQTEGISVQIGVFHIAAIVFSLLFVLKAKEKRRRNVFLFSLFLLSLSLFFMQPLSKFFWEKISLLRQFQFPWRFLSLIVLASSLCAISFIELLKKKFFTVIIALFVIFTSIPYWNPSLGYDTIDENYYWNFPLNTTYYGETDVVWSAGPAKAYAKKPIDVIDGDATVSQYSKKNHYHTYTVTVRKDAAFVDHTQYFPGWVVYVDEKPVSVQFQDASWRGEITFRAPVGIHTVKVIFEETAIRQIADGLSLVTLAGLIAYPFVQKKLQQT